MLYFSFDRGTGITVAAAQDRHDRIPHPLILLVSLAGLAAGPSEAQQPPRVPRLCFLTFDPGTVRTRSPRFDAFFQGLENLGYFDGRTIEIRYLSAHNTGDRFPALIDECLSLKPDVIAVTTTPAAQLLKKATSTISIVMVALATLSAQGSLIIYPSPPATSLECQRWGRSLRSSGSSF